MIKRLWAWWRGYTIEEWVNDKYRDALAMYAGELARERIEVHGTFPHDERWHYLVMTFKRGRRRFYFDGAPWPR